MRVRIPILLAGLLLATSAAWACSCQKQTTEQHFRQATHVFLARVVATHEVVPKPELREWGKVAATYTTTKVLKGSAPKGSEVQSGYGSGDCGVPLFVGRTYLFFASVSREVDICSGTFDFVKGYEPHDRLLTQLEALAAKLR